MKKVIFTLFLFVSIVLTACGSKTYTVNFDVKGGSPEIASIQVKDGDKIPRQTEPKKDNYVFGGWYILGENTRWNFEIHKVTSDITLYAQWNEPEADTTAPVITGEKDINYVIGSPAPNYLDGLKATDNIDGDLTSQIEVDDSKVDLTKEGTYALTYTVTDSSGNVGRKIIAVIVSSTDVTKPVFYGLKDEIRIVVGTLDFDFLEGIQAIDNVDGDITSLIEVDSSKVDLTTEGTYTLSLSVADSSNNVNTATIKIIVTPDLTSYLDNLDLKGQTITYFTHVLAEDNPFDPGYVGEYAQEYREFLTDLQAKYNFTLNFTSVGNYDERLQTISQFVSGNSGSAILRIAELDFLIELLSGRYLADFTDTANLLGSTYAIDDWQTGAGTIQGRVYGLQNKDANKYVELLVYNKALLEQAGITKTPTELWLEGEWTVDKMEEYLDQIAKSSVTASPFGITPHHVAMYAPAANGAKFVNADGTINLINTQTLNSISKYKQWYDRGYISKLDFSKTILKQDAFNPWTGGNSVFAVAMMWQLSGANTPFEYSIVPFPQEAGKSKTDYYTPLSSGDLLTVTVGNNSDEISSILFLINEFHKEKRAEEMATYKALHPDLDDIELLSLYNVEEYLKLSNETDIQQAQQVFAFLQGLDEFKATKINDLAYLNGETEYVNAVKNYFAQGGSPRNHIEGIIPVIQSKIQRILDVIQEKN